MDTYADDLAKLVEALDLKDAIHVGHSTGGGEVARYLGRYGSKRVATAVLIGAVPPIMLKTPKSQPAGPAATFQSSNARLADDIASPLRKDPVRFADCRSVNQTSSAKFSTVVLDEPIVRTNKNARATYPMSKSSGVIGDLARVTSVWHGSCIHSAES